MVITGKNGEKYKINWELSSFRLPYDKNQKSLARVQCKVTLEDKVIGEGEARQKRLFPCDPLMGQKVSLAKALKDSRATF